MKTLALLPLALLSTAAMAQDYPPPPAPYDQARDQRPADARNYGYDDGRDGTRRSVDPQTAMAVAGAVRAVTDAILDVRVDGVRRAADPYARNNEVAQTIGDLMARRDPNYREHLHQDMARAGRTAIGAARSAGDIKAAADEFARRIEGVLNAAGY